MEILILFLLMLLSGLFAMAEIALVSSRKVRLEKLAKHGNRRAAITLKMANQPHRFLSTVQVGITLLGIIAGAYSSSTLALPVEDFLKSKNIFPSYAHELAITLVIALTTYLSLLVGELVPKSIALTRPEKTAILLTPVMNIVSMIVMPAVYLMEFSTKLVLKLFRIKPSSEPPVTEEELKHLIEIGSMHGVLEKQESRMMKSIFRTADRNVSTIMTHRGNIIWVDQNITQEGIQKIIEETVHTYFPVCDSSLDQVNGIVSIKDILIQLGRKKEFNMRELIRQPLYVPESMPALELLESFRKTKNHIALVVNEYGALEGLVTLHDLVESIFGFFPVAEKEYVEEAMKRADGSWLIDGIMLTDEWSELLGIKDMTEEESSAYNTLGGFMMHHIGHIPKPTDKFRFRNYFFEVMDMDGKRVDKVLVTKAE